MICDNDIRGIDKRKEYIESLLVKLENPNLVVLPELALSSYNDRRKRLYNQTKDQEISLILFPHGSPSNPNKLIQEKSTNDLIQALINERNWDNLDDFNKIEAIYNFVRDEIRFGYNVDDKIAASRVLKDGYGQCNTKGILFMALLRAVGIPCLIHGFTIDKKLQKGAMTGIVYKSAPQNIFHSWVEVYYHNKWFELEAFILDIDYLKQLQKINATCYGTFCGYGVAVKDFKNPIIDWNENNTYIQSEGINQDFGIYDDPDSLLKKHHQEMSLIKKCLYRYIGRHLMNYNIKKIRNGT